MCVSLQKLCNPHMAFDRFVHSIVAEDCEFEYRLKAGAIDALHEGAEAYMVGLFSLAQVNPIHSHRLTVQVKDLQLVLMKKGR